MQFGPLEIETCGENNYTVKTLGLLAFRPDLRRRFAEHVFKDCPPLGDSTDIRIQFFSRIGEDFVREAIERQGTQPFLSELERQLNAPLGLPESFLWARTRNQLLIQPAKWQARHIEEMLKKNGHADNYALRAALNYIQDYLNTEPDIVLQWENHLGIVEIKVLSGEGPGELDRQIHLGELFASLLGWQTHFSYIGPGYGPRPSQACYKFVAWEEVANLFTDVPDIKNYIHDFAFFYKRTWQTMVHPPTEKLPKTVWDLVKSP